MPRPIWSGAVSFGLVNVPVKLTTAQSPKDVRFNQLDGKDGTRISTKRVRPDTGEEVPYERLVKGYEISPNRYVVIEPSELEALDPEASRTIDIEEFVSLEEIDPLYFEKGYYLLPDKGAEKAYALLAKAMEETGRVAIARFVMRTKQYLAAIRAKDGALVLSTMLYSDEVTTAGQLDLPDMEKVAPSEREVKMAEQLIESLSAEFDPARYKDEHREKVLALIEAKSEGQEIVTSPTAEEPTRVVDLMAALEASLAAAKQSRADAAKGQAEPVAVASGAPAAESKSA
ncbi:MAG: Ku protein [Acidimicrobiales bacterium]